MAFSQVDILEEFADAAHTGRQTYDADTYLAARAESFSGLLESQPSGWTEKDNESRRRRMEDPVKRFLYNKYVAEWRTRNPERRTMMDRANRQRPEIKAKEVKKHHEQWLAIKNNPELHEKYKRDRNERRKKAREEAQRCRQDGGHVLADAHGDGREGDRAGRKGLRRVSCTTRAGLGLTEGYGVFGPVLGNQGIRREF